MNDTVLKTVSDRLTNVHHRIQANHSDINPVVGVNRQMRTQGIPADAITIDCLKTNRRVLLVLHDEKPELVHCQFGFRDRDPDPGFSQITFEQLTEAQLYDWIIGYFQDEGFNPAQ